MENDFFSLYFSYIQDMDVLCSIYDLFDSLSSNILELTAESWAQRCNSIFMNSVHFYEHPAIQKDEKQRQRHAVDFRLASNDTNSVSNNKIKRYIHIQCLKHFYSIYNAISCRYFIEPCTPKSSTAPDCYAKRDKKPSVGMNNNNNNANKI